MDEDVTPTPEQILERDRLAIEKLRLENEAAAAEHARDLELARLSAGASNDRGKNREKISVAFVVGLLALSDIIAQAILSSQGKKVPEAFGSLLPLLAGGLTTVLGMQISDSQSSKKG